MGSPGGYAIGHAWTIHSNLVHKLTYGYARQAFDPGGELFHNDIDVPLVDYPTNEQHTWSHETPVHPWVDDVS